MSKAAVYNLLATDAQLQSLGLPSTGVFLAGTTDTPDERPFLALAWGNENRGLSWESQPGTRELVIWVHDIPGDYERIDAIIKRIRTLLSTSVHVEGLDGYTLTQADWTGTSGDLQDDGHGTFVRTVGFTVVSREST
jgi:hypothetical protein